MPKFSVCEVSAEHKMWNIKCSLFIKHLLVVTCFIVVLALMAFFVTFIFECSVCCGDEKAVRMVCVVKIIPCYIQFNVK